MQRGDNSKTVDCYTADVVAFSDYSPFGMLMPGRNGSATDNYRYGFQGQEKDDEVKGEGNPINYKYRMHDPRVGRFFAVDPLAGKYPWYTPYQFSGNKVISHTELEGLEEKNAVEIKPNESPEIKVLTFKNILIERMEAAGMTLDFGFPSVEYVEDLNSIARYSNNKIEVKYNYSKGVTKGIMTEDDWISVIRHEYEHFLDDKLNKYPLQVREDGTIENQFNVTEPYTYTPTENEVKAAQALWDRELNSLTEEFGEKQANDFMKYSPRPSNEATEKTVSRWKYSPSNLQLTEINSYSKQLVGVEQGLYKLSDEFIVVIKGRLDTYQRKYERNLKYEQENNLNADGTKNE